MSQLDKQQLLVENNASFPNNNIGYITPELLRNFNADMIDSLTLQTQTNALSASIQQLVASGSGVKVADSGSTLGTATTLFFTGSVGVSLNNGTASINVIAQAGTNGTSGTSIVPANTNVWTYKQGVAPSVPVSSFDTTGTTLNGITAVWINGTTNGDSYTQLFSYLANLDLTSDTYEIQFTNVNNNTQFGLYRVNASSWNGSV